MIACAPWKPRPCCSFSSACCWVLAGASPPVAEPATCASTRSWPSTAARRASWRRCAGLNTPRWSGRHWPRSTSRGCGRRSTTNGGPRPSVWAWSSRASSASAKRSRPCPRRRWRAQAASSSNLPRPVSRKSAPTPPATWSSAEPRSNTSSGPCARSSARWSTALRIWRPRVSRPTRPLSSRFAASNRRPRACGPRPRRWSRRCASPRLAEPGGRCSCDGWSRSPG